MFHNVGKYNQMPTKRNTAGGAATAALKRAGILRARDLEKVGVSRTSLARLERAGCVTRSARGVYVLADREVAPHHGLAVAQQRVPHGVICLLSALAFHELTATVPHEVWIAIDPKARLPRASWPPLRVVRFSEQARRGPGIVVVRIDRTTVHITSPARTVVDAFKYRNKIGIDVAVEALKAFRTTRGNVDDLWHIAAARGVARVMRPYLEAT